MRKIGAFSLTRLLPIAMPTRSACVFATSLIGAATALGCVDLRPPVPDSGYRALVSVQSTDTLSATSAMVPAASAAPATTQISESYSSGKLRREIKGADEKTIFIDRPDLRVSWVLNTEKNSFDERHISEINEHRPWLLNPFGPRAKADFELIGPEDIAQTPALKYKVSGKRVEGLAWFTQEGIPLRFRGSLRIGDAQADVEIDYSDIKRGPQPAWLFAVPPNFAGYEDRKKPATPDTNADPESIRRARERLQREQMQGQGPAF